MRHSERVLIIGAGPSGLASAIALRRVGIRAEVFEQSPRHLAFGGGFTIRSNTVKLLLRLGVGQRLLEKGVEYRSFEYYSASGRRLNGLPEGAVADAWGAPSIGALRADLYAALMAEIDQDVVHLDARFLGAEQDEDGVTARFADGREERGRLLLGCDGMHSVVRELVLEGAEPSYAGFVTWRNSIIQEPVIVPRGEVRLYLGVGKAIVMFPCSERQLSMDCFVRGPAGGSDSPGRVRRRCSVRSPGSATRCSVRWGPRRSRVSAVVTCTSAIPVPHGSRGGSCCLVTRSTRRRRSSGRVPVPRWRTASRLPRSSR